MKHVIGVLSLLSLQTAGGQTPDITYHAADGSIVSGVRCATVDTAPPDIGRTPEDLRQWLYTGETILIPVAFHVITSSGGTGDVPDDQIDRQIDTLNAGYGGTGFAFYLSSVDRTANDNWFFSPGTYESQMKSALAIDPLYNFNIYTAAPSGGVLGWAWLPWDWPESSFWHGIVILYSTLPGGSAFPFNEGKTATHEAGHYLGLYHTFEGGCTPPGDEVDDTPYESSPAFGCPIGRNTCPNEPDPDPIHNFMDYTDDACMFEFTGGQAERSTWAVMTYKPGLLVAALVPNPPSDLRAYSDYTTPTSIELSWEDPTMLVSGDSLFAGSFHVHIYRDGVFVDSVAGGAEIFVDEGLTDGESYLYELSAKLDTSERMSAYEAVTGTAGGSHIPGTPLEFGVSGNQTEVTLSWTNPATNVDGSPMIDFAGIHLYQDGVPVATYARSPSDTGNAESVPFTPAVQGTYSWYLTSFDNELPENESPPTTIIMTPLSLPALDAFQEEGAPGGMWVSTNGDVNSRSNNPPSPSFALNLNGAPIGRDTVEMRPIDLAGLQDSGIVFAYSYQPQGNGDAPEPGDSLRVHFRNDLGQWVLIASYPGSPLQPFRQSVVGLDTASAGGGTFFYSQFQARFSSTGGAGTIPNDDWFVDNVFLGESTPAVAASADTAMMDTTAVGATSFFTLFVSNIGLEDLFVSNLVLSDTSVFSVDTTSFSLPSGTFGAVTIGFMPDHAGTFYGVLSIVSNDFRQDTLKVVLKGVGDIPVETRGAEGVPDAFSVSPNYPNPFNPSTTIRYEIPVSAHAELHVFDLLGRHIRTLFAGEVQPGSYQVTWDGTNDRGVNVGSGIYIYRFSSAGYTAVRKMILIK